MTGYTYRKIDIEKVYNFSNTIENDGNYLIDSLNRIITNIDQLKQEHIVQGKVADVLSQIAGDSYQTVKEFQKSVINYAQMVKKAADTAKALDEKYSQEMLNNKLLSDLNYKSNSNNNYRAYVDSSKNIRVDSKGPGTNQQTPGYYPDKQ
jgi:hypothetical protein